MIRDLPPLGRFDRSAAALSLSAIHYTLGIMGMNVEVLADPTIPSIPTFLGGIALKGIFTHRL